MPAQGALYFRCTGHQVFWDKVRRNAQEAALTTRSRSFVIQIFEFEGASFFFLILPGDNGGGN